MQATALSTTHLVDRLIEVRADVETVQDVEGVAGFGGNDLEANMAYYGAESGMEKLTALKARSEKEYELFRKTFAHVIMGLGGENEKDTAKRIADYETKHGKISDEQIIKGMAAVMRVDAFNHKELQSIDPAVNLFTVDYRDIIRNALWGPRTGKVRRVVGGRWSALPNLRRGVARSLSRARSDARPRARPSAE